jgi:hypothetical protein
MTASFARPRSPSTCDSSKAFLVSSIFTLKEQRYIILYYAEIDHAPVYAPRNHLQIFPSSAYVLPQSVEEPEFEYLRPPSTLRRQDKTSE